MKTITLDLSNYATPKDVHSYLKEMMEFPWDYADNLEALYDELTSHMENITIEVIYPADAQGAMADYFPKIIQVFEDALKINYHMKVRFLPVE